MESSSIWTTAENKIFETALAIYGETNPDRWQNIARDVGTKTVEEVKTHYQKLVDDIEDIEAGRVPLPDYRRCRPNGQAKS